MGIQGDYKPLLGKHDVKAAHFRSVGRIRMYKKEHLKG